MAEAGGAGGDLDRWLAPFLAALGHKKRRTWAPLYLPGLLGPGGCETRQRLAARLGRPRRARAQEAPARGASLPAGLDGPGRAQEPAAHGGPAGPVRARPAAALHRQ